MTLMVLLFSALHSCSAVKKCAYLHLPPTKDVTTEGNISCLLGLVGYDFRLPQCLVFGIKKARYF